MIRVAIITISDRCSRGERKDLSGPKLKELACTLDVEIVGEVIVSDDVERIKAQLLDMALMKKADLILTTGGTGFAPRDVTPEATRAVIEIEIPGIAEAMRTQNLKITPNAMLSRGVAGLLGKSLIINFPGSVKAVEENWHIVSPVILHALHMVTGEDHESPV